jgi:hypothetical protein
MVESRYHKYSSLIFYLLIELYLSGSIIATETQDMKDKKSIKGKMEKVSITRNIYIITEKRKE